MQCVSLLLDPAFPSLPRGPWGALDHAPSSAHMEPSGNPMLTNSHFLPLPPRPPAPPNNNRNNDDDDDNNNGLNFPLQFWTLSY